MKNWINFTNIRTNKYDNKTNKFIDCSPYHCDSIGSFGNITFDGRYNLDTLINLCYEYMFKNNYDGFKIYKGEWLNENNLMYTKR